MSLCHSCYCPAQRVLSLVNLPTIAMPIFLPGRSILEVLWQYPSLLCRVTQNPKRVLTSRVERIHVALRLRCCSGGCCCVSAEISLLHLDLIRIMLSVAPRWLVSRHGMPYIYAEMT